MGRFRDDDDNALDVLLALTVGVGLGLGLGLLFAPKAGHKTRRQIAQAADESLDAIRERADDFRGAASDMADKGRRTMQGHKETVLQALDDAKKAYRDVVS